MEIIFYIPSLGTEFFSVVTAWHVVFFTRVLRWVVRVELEQFCKKRFCGEMNSLQDGAFPINNNFYHIPLLVKKE